MKQLLPHAELSLAAAAAVSAAAFQNRVSERFTIRSSLSICQKDQLLTRYFSAKMREICPAFLFSCGRDKEREKVEPAELQYPLGHCSVYDRKLQLQRQFGQSLEERRKKSIEYL